jgi:hypothetical protein
MAIVIDFAPDMQPPGILTPERVRKAAAIYLGVKCELMKFDDVTEDFARAHAESARDAYIRQCYAGRAR